MFKVTTVLRDAEIVCNDTITLDFLNRYRRRCLLESDQGYQFLLDLNQTTLLRQGDVLKLQDHYLILVQEKEEPILEIQAITPQALLRFAWLLGNAHCGIQILENKLAIQYDPVLEQQIIQLDGIVQQKMAPFTPNFIGHFHGSD